MAEYFEFKGVRLSNYRGKLTPMGVVWVRLAYLAVLNRYLDQPSFRWSEKSAAASAQCRKATASDYLASAVAAGVVTRQKTKVGENIMWSYQEGDAAEELYRRAVFAGHAEAVKDEVAAEQAEELAAKHLLMGLDKMLLIQLARESIDGFAVVTVRNLAEELTEQMRLREDDETIEVSRMKVHRVLKRLEGKLLVDPISDVGTRRTVLKVALTEADVAKIKALREEEQCDTDAPKCD